MATKLSILLILAFTSTYITESRKELRTKDPNFVIQLGPARPPNTIDPSRVTQLSWRPRLFLYNGFLSDQECDHLMRSLGNDSKDKSSGNNSANAVDEIVARIDERLSAWTFLPKGNGKVFRVFHSGPEETKETNNYLGNSSMWQTGESVMATIVMYLSNVTQGGQILFPVAESGSLRPKNIWSHCTKSSQIAKPIKGNAILFFNLHPNTSLDPSSSHVRCPVTEGDMWWATKIFVVKPVAPQNKLESETGDDDGLCTDEDDSCPQWAAVGECEKNPIFMVGTADYYGTCRKSCNAC